MKRTSLLRHLSVHGCFLLREGKRHSVFYCPATGRTSTVPRHRDVHEFLAEKICKDLAIPSARK